MRRLLLLAFLACSVPSAMAQLGYGNEWIDYGRQYWKFEVYADGTYRIDSAALAQAGFPLAAVDPRHLMLFGKEQQVPIYVRGEDDGAFNSGDFIEFRAEKADGMCDRRLYPFPDADPNPYISLYNDTVRYFLTWDASAPAMHIRDYSNSNVGAYTPEPWAWSTGLAAFKDFFWVGKIDEQLANYGITGTSAMMIESEGFGYFSLYTDGGVTAALESWDIGVPTPAPYTGGGAPPARVTATAAAQNSIGSNLANHHLVLKYGPGLNTVGEDTIYGGAVVMRASFDMPTADMGPTTTIRYNAPHDLYGPGQAGASGFPNYLDWQAISNVLIRYPRTMDMSAGNAASMEVPAGGPVQRLDLYNYNGTPVVYAWGDTVRRIVPTLGSAWHTLFPAMPGNEDTRVQVFAQETVQPITALRKATPTGYFTDYGALDLDSAVLIVAHQALMNGGMAYRNYRQSEAPPPHRYSTLLVDVDELYDQYGAGVPKNAGGIRLFSKHLFDTWTAKPRGLFLIGKGVNTWSAFASNLPGIRPDADGAYARTLVPSYGFPSSDQCFTTGLDFDSRRMDIPVGRLSAYTDADVLAYLAKVRATELAASTPALWQKNVLHFAGGVSADEIGTHANDLAGFGQIAADTAFGGHVVPFRKNTSEVIGQASADSVRHFIEEEGVTLMTFLAHAYSSSFDITIDEPQNYDWGGKHPMVIGNSCYIGNVHLNGNFSTSEEWVTMADAGPSSFLASISQGLRPYLVVFTSNFYESFSRINYGGTIGEHMQHAGFAAQSQWPTLPMQWHVHTFHLEGDPMLTLNTQPLPDYAVRAEEVFFDPAIVTADVDSFSVKVVVSNLGKAINASLNVELQRSNQGIGTVSQFATVSNVYLIDTVTFRVPTLGFTGGQGTNQFTVRVDLGPDLVDEMDDVVNNTASTSLFITSGDIVPVYPYDFAIVPDPVVTLKASTGDPLAPVRTYVFQIDTTDTFDSPSMESHTTQAPGGVVSWQPQAIFGINTVRDSTVFFWRCSIDSASSGNGQYNWYERSFQWITGKRGWGQAHIFQFKKDRFSGIQLDRPNREFDFDESEKNVRANVTGNVGGQGINWSLDLAAQDYGGCGPAAWHVAVIDPVTFDAWGTYWVSPQGTVYNPDHQFGNSNNNGTCRGRVEKYFAFHTNSPGELAALQTMLDDEIPDGYHILIYSWLYLDRYGTIASGGSGVMDLLEQFGAPSFDALPDSVPYICYVRKGDPSTFQDTVGVAIDDVVSLSIWVPTAFAQGVITAVDAGPAFSWDAFYWDEQPSDIYDSTRIKLQGIPEGSVQGMELLSLSSAQDSVPDLENYVDAAMYPTVRVQGYFHDGNVSDAQPAQLKRWQLLCSPAPECAIHPPLGYFNALDGWAEGQEAAVAVAVQNISEFDMDSLLIAAWVIDQSNQRRGVHYRLNAPLPAGAFVLDTVRFSTLDLGGWNTLLIEANPIDSATGTYAQLEQYRFNNIAQWRFEVDQDRENPILDVTFDGRHILDGDIVSARPEIQITLDDESIVRLLDSPQDTAQFKVFLQQPGAGLQRIWFRDGAGNEVLQFIPANGPDNVARILYRPRFEADGDYALTVQASDLSNNASGDNDYKARFEVVNRSTITEVLNYPNPFTTSTRFVFTLTGSVVPTHLRVQILTVTGKVVREIGLAELGPIYVGRNITEFAWDGTDQFGDRLARGVYLYRVIAQINGEDIEMRETSASQYFNKGFGKMYLMR